MGSIRKEGDDWYKVRRDHSMFKKEKLGHGDHDRRHVSTDIQSFLVTKFLDSVLITDIWRVCARFENVVDVFVSKKLPRMGKCFGFVRFSGGSDVES